MIELKEPLNVLSLGAGVQSTTLALMGEQGIIKIDVAIFADTQGEPDVVYKHLDWLKTQITKYPIRVMSKGSLEEATFSNTRTASIPFYLRDGDKVGISRRQCTFEYKIQVVYKQVRAELELKPYQRPKLPLGYDHCVNMIMGITTDEALRVRVNSVKWIKNVYPFIDRFPLSRQDCLKWLEVNDYPKPPKSACYFCPYHNQAFWVDMKENQPEEFAKAVEFDERLRSPEYKSKFKRDQYLHFKAIPLKEAVNLPDNKDEDWGFNNECEGMCGL